MLDATLTAIPCDIAIFTAAVADWRPDVKAASKIKKGSSTPEIKLVENPDILATISGLPPSTRPKLVIGFAAESENLIKNAKHKLQHKGCDVIAVNDVKNGQIFGSDENEITLVTSGAEVKLGKNSKQKLAELIADYAANAVTEL